MAGFLYFLPKKTAVDLDGIGYAFDDKTHATGRQVIGSGPDGGTGIVVVDDRHIDASQFGYYKDRQQWRRIPKCDAWLGWYADALPGPTDLARDKMLNGPLVRLGDGNDWLTPVVRGLTEEDGELRWHSPLPQSSRLNDDGEWITDGVAAKFAHLLPIAEAWFDALRGADPEDGTMTFEFDGLHAAAVTLLQTNYRLGPVEADALGLLDEQHAVGILNAAADWDTFVGWLKKKQPTNDRKDDAGGST